MTEQHYSISFLIDEIDSNPTETRLQKMERREKTICHMLQRERISKEDLFWLRVDIGIEYLNRMRIPAVDREALRQDPSFWDWWRLIWDQGDMEMIKRFKSIDGDYVFIGLSYDKYITFLSSYMRRFNVNRVLMDLSREKMRGK